jgi:hypothetical protein
MAPTTPITPKPWVSRVWQFGLAPELLPQILERLRGMPARAEELAASVSVDTFRTRPPAKWSAQEHLAHLDDLSQLDDARLSEFLAGTRELTAGDVTNPRTWQANHNSRSVAELLLRLRANRLALVHRLERLSLADASRFAAHPRLQQQMSVVDWMFFVAEHDDHHLALARRAVRLVADRE